MMVKSRTFIATPPGATIKEQLLDKGMSQKEFATYQQIDQWRSSIDAGCCLSFRNGIRYSS